MSVDLCVLRHKPCFGFERCVFFKKFGGTILQYLEDSQLQSWFMN